MADPLIANNDRDSLTMVIPVIAINCYDSDNGCPSNCHLWLWLSDKGGRYNGNQFPSQFAQSNLHLNCKMAFPLTH